MEVWLAHRSLATLELRIQRQCENAMRVASPRGPTGGAGREISRASHETRPME